MSDRDALLAAILANPDEDTPRLAYADWLDEYGEPERAEFIRLQIELARLRYGSPEHMAQKHFVIDGPMQDLLERHREKWIAELGLPAIPAHRLRFHRGFPAHFQTTVADFLAHGAALVQVAPIQCVQFIPLTLQDLPALAASPAFRAVPGVTLDFLDSQAEAIAEFVHSVPVGHLRSISVVYSFDLPLSALRPLGDCLCLGLRIVACPHLNGLKRLRLNACFGCKEAANFVEAPGLAGLELMDLSDNDVDEETAAQLRQKFGDALVLDDADYCRFTFGQLDLGWGY